MQEEVCDYGHSGIGRLTQLSIGSLLLADCKCRVGVAGVTKRDQPGRGDNVAQFLAGSVPRADDSTI